MHGKSPAGFPRHRAQRQRAPRLHQLARALLTACLLSPALLLAPTARAAGPALPSGLQVVSGQASTVTQGNQLTVRNTPNAILNWQSFNIGAANQVYFDQASAASKVLNRVVGNDPSSILGSLASNGQVWLLNPNGVLFGQGARVDVQSLVTSTLRLNDSDFLAGRYRFSAIDGNTAGMPAGINNAGISNAGSLNSSFGGQIVLLGARVENSGEINAPGGNVSLAAARSVELVDTGLPNLVVKVDVPAGEVLNLGRLAAPGGKVDVHAAIVNQQGLVRADSFGADAQGQITLQASDTLTLAGKLDTSSATGRGGSVLVEADRILLDTTAVIDASGATGGGSVRVGGDFQGKNPDVHNATLVLVAPGAQVLANATVQGDGGRVVIWSDDMTRFLGRVDARGGALGGNGGFVEVSGKRLLDFAGSVNVTAARGLSGTLLLDPDFIVIRDDNPNITGVTGGNADLGSAHTISFADYPASTSPPASGVSTITAGALSTQLGSGNVVLQANTDISVLGGADITGSNALTLQAGHNIDIARNIAANGGITLSANDPGGAANGTGRVQLPGNLTLSAGAGTLTITNNGGSGVHMLGGDLSAQTLSITGPVQLTSAPRWTVLGGLTSEVSGVISQGTPGLSITKLGGGRLTLGGANTTTGPTTVSAGTLAVTNAGALGAASSTVNVAAGATLEVVGVTVPQALVLTGSGTGGPGTGALVGNGTAGVSGSITLTGEAWMGVAGTAASLTLSGVISGGNLVLNSQGGSGQNYSFTLTGANSYTDTRLENAAFVHVGNGGTSGSLGTGDVFVNGSNLQFWRSDSITVANPIIGNGSLEQNGTGTVTLAANNAYGGYTAVNAGTLNMTGTSQTGAVLVGAAGTLTLGTAGRLLAVPTVDVAAGGTLHLGGNETVSSLSGGGDVDLGTGTGAGTLTVNGASSTTFAGVLSGSGGLTRQGTGNLTLTGANTYSGATTVAAGTLDLSSTTGSVTRDTVLLQGGALGGTANLTVTGTLAMSGGTLNSSGSLTLADGASFTWTGGTLSQLLTLQPAATLAITGSGSKTISSGTLDNFGQAIWDGAGSIVLAFNGVLRNRPNAQFTLTGDGVIGYGGGSGVFVDNQGTFTKSGGSGALDMRNAAISNTGLLDVQSGSLLLTDGGVHAGTVNAAPGTSVALAPGFNTLRIDTGAVFTGGGSFSIAGDSSLNGNLQVQGSSTVLTLNTGVLAGAGNLTVGGGNTLVLDGGTLVGSGQATVEDGASMIWSGGTLSRVLTLQPAATLIFTGSNAKTISGGTLDNFGQASWDGAGRIVLANNGVLRSRPGAQFTLNGGGVIDYGGGSGDFFDNQGTFTKTGSGALDMSTAYLMNSGLVDVRGGSLLLTDGGAHAGTLNVAPGTSVTMSPGFNGTTINSGAVFTGGGTVTLAGDASLNGSLQVQGSGTVVNLTSGSLSGPGSLSLESGTALNLSGGALSIGGYSQSGGTLAGSGNLTVTSAFAQTGGSIATSGDVVLTQASGDLALGALSANTLTATALAGSVNASGRLSTVGNATLVAHGATSNVTVAADVTGTGAAGSTLLLQADNNVVVGPSVLIGSTNARNLVLNADHDASGAGNVQIGSFTEVNGELGPLTLVGSAGGNITLGGGAAPATGYASGSGNGTGIGAGNSPQEASGIYIDGRIAAGGGNVTLHGRSAAAAGDGITFNGGTLSSDGTVLIDGITSANGSTATGHSFVAGVRFLNAGTRLTTATGTVGITGLSTGNGLRTQGVMVDTATIETTGRGTLTVNGTSSSANTDWGVGIFSGATVRTTAAGGGSLTLNGRSLAADSGLFVFDSSITSGGGEIRLSGQSAGGESLGIFGSTVGGPASGDILLRALGGGTAPLDLGVTNNIGGGRSTVNAGSSTLTIVLSGQTASDSGLAGNVISAGSLRLLGNGSFALTSTSNHVATLAADVGGSVSYRDSSALAVGVVTSFDGSLTTATAGVVANTLGLNVGAGAGTLTVNAGATLAGSGTVTGNLLNLGTLSPGGIGSAGTLNVTGNLDLASGLLAVDLGGTGAGASDRLAVAGNTTLGGNLTAALIGSYVPSNADFIPILTVNGTTGGNFAGTFLPTGFSAGYNLAPQEAVRLVYSSGSNTKIFINAANNLDWSTPINWTGGLPGAGDTALISAGFAVVHATGTDLIGALTINATNALNVSGGSLTVTGATLLGGALNVSSAGALTLGGTLGGGGSVGVQGGTLLLNGASTVASLDLAGGLLAGSGSLTVTDAFTRSSAASVGSGFSSISLTQRAGDLAPGALSAGAITLNAQDADATLRIDGAVVSGGAMTVTAAGALQLLASAGPAALVATTGDQTISAASVLLRGGASGQGNAALIVANTGAQHLTAGSLTLAGGAAGSGNDALVVAQLGTQTIDVSGSISLAGGAAGSANAAGLSASTQAITVGQDVSLTAGGSAIGSTAGGAWIGNLRSGSTAALQQTLAVGGTLTLSGGSSGAQAGIGNAPGAARDASIRITAGGDIVLNPGTVAGSGSYIGASLGSALPGGSIDLATTNGHIVLAGQIAGSPVADVTVRSGGDVRLSAHSVDLGGLVTGRTVQATASNDLVLRDAAVLTASASSGDTLVLRSGSGSFTNTAGAGVLVTAGSGRWLVWSTDPEADRVGGLRPAFRQLNAQFGSSTPAAAGNGLLYALAPVLTVGLQGQVAKTYDGGTAATLTGANYLTSGLLTGDRATLNNPTQGTYVSAGTGATVQGVGTGKTVQVGGLSLSVTDTASGIPVYGYQFNATASGAVGSITPATLSYTATPTLGVAGSVLPLLTGNVLGFVAGETVANATTGTLAWTSTATATSAPGSYAINGSGLSAANYVFTQAAGNASALLLGTGTGPTPNPPPTAPSQLPEVAAALSASTVATPQALHDVTLATVMSTPTTGRVLDVTPFVFSPSFLRWGEGRTDDASDATAFRPVNFSLLTREEIQTLLAARDSYKKQIFGRGISQLEIDPALADVRSCRNEAELRIGNCLISVQLKQEMQAAAARTAASAQRHDKRKVKLAALPNIERKLALLIGINRYTDKRVPTLEGAVPDVRAVRTLLESRLGYETTVLEDPTREAIIRAFNKLALEADAEDSVVIYYAGHGVVVPIGSTEVGFWLPGDSNAEDPLTWLSNADIGRLVGAVGARQLMLVSDSCYSGALAGSERVQVDRNSDAAALLSRKAAVVMSSGGNEPVADEGREGHSVFAWHFMRAVEGVSGWQIGNNVFEQVRAAVAKDFPQMPQYGASRAAGHQGNTDYLFERRELDAVTP